MNRARVAFGILGALLAPGIFLPPPAQACDHPRHKYCGGYDDYDDDDCDYYRPRRRVVYIEEEDCDYYRPRHYRPVYRYRCHDCGQRFGSRYWLSYHYRHSRCD